MKKTTAPNSVKRMWRKVLSWILMMSMTISLTAALFPVTAMAATQSSAKSFMDKNKGIQIHNRGSECVALYNQYLYKVFGKTAPNVNYAYQIYDRNHWGWEKIRTFTPEEYRIWREEIV